MKTKLPDHPADFARQHLDIWAAFEALADRCHKAGPLDVRTRRLVKLGIALGAGLEGGVHSQVRNALAEGIPPAQLRHFVLASLATIGFPASMAACTWVNDLLDARRRGGKKGK